MLILSTMLIVAAPGGQAASTPASGVAPMQPSTIHQSAVAPPPLLVRPGLNSPIHPLVPVEQGVADVTELAVGLRDISPGLEEPSGFSRLFQVPGRGDLLMRASGGLYAVFPQSVYVAGENGGSVPVIPNNTVFYIGQPALLALAAKDRKPLESNTDATAPDDLRLDRRSDSEASAQKFGVSVRPMSADQMAASQSAAVTAGAQSGIQAPTIVNDAAYRRARLHQLLKQAAAAEAESDQPQ